MLEKHGRGGAFGRQHLYMYIGQVARKSGGCRNGRQEKSDGSGAAFSVYRATIASLNPNVYSFSSLASPPPSKALPCEKSRLPLHIACALCLPLSTPRGCCK